MNSTLNLGFYWIIWSPKCYFRISTDYKNSFFIHVDELGPLMTQQILTAFLMAGIGPVPMTEGSRPA